MICDKCKRFFMAGNRPDGIPNGVKMILKNNESITLCAQCLIDLGKMNEDQKAEFFNELKGKTK